jgi:hypothetical protein
VNIKFNKKKVLWFEKNLRLRFNNNIKLSYKNKKIHLTIKGKKGEIIFTHICENFYKPGYQPEARYWDPSKENWNSLSGSCILAPNIQRMLPVIKKKKYIYTINYDILGLAFWMLNRLEEANPQFFDKHNRFRSKNSFLNKNNYLHKPIVDEWLFILEQVIKKNWPGISIKKHSYAVTLIHDVDRPYKYKFLNHLQFTIILLKQFKNFFSFNFLKEIIFFKKLNEKEQNFIDPYYTFDWIMNMSDAFKIKSRFNFMCGGISYRYDSNYNLLDRSILNLIKNVLARGHEIGIHFSYRASENYKLAKKEKNYFLDLLRILNIKNFLLYSSMHYLRFNILTTPNFLNRLNVRLDTSLGYSDKSGFRCGTSHPFYSYDLKNDKIIDLKLSPLIFNDMAILDLDKTSWSQKIKKIKQIVHLVRKSKGQINLLWHNSSLDELQKKKYYKVLKLITN